MKRINFKQALSYAKQEYIRWICDARMIILSILLIFVYNFAIEPLLNNAKEMGASLNILEPFIAIANSGLILLIIPLVFITLISDFPKIDTSTVLCIIRVGRVNWLIGQIIKLVMMAVSYLAFILIGAVIPMMRNGFWGNKWSDVTTNFAVVFPEKSQNFGVQLLPENLYNQLSVYSATLQSYLLILAYLIILGLLLLAFSLIKKKAVGYVICGAIISLGTAFCSINSMLMWTMPMANAIIWLHFTKYFRQPVIPLQFSIIYLSVCIGALLIFCFSVIRKINYYNMIE